MIKYIFLIIISFSLNLQAQKANKHKDCTWCLHTDKTGEDSPYTINFKKELPYFMTSLGLLGSGLLIKEVNEEAPFSALELAQLDGSKINSFDRNAIYNSSAIARDWSNYTLITGAVLPFYFLANHHTKNDFFPLLIMGVEVFSITSTLALNAKYTFNRTRPLAYNTSFSEEFRTSGTSKLSYFSGHTAQTACLSFFMAKVISDYHPNMKRGTKIGLWTFAVALPAVTGYLRVQGGKHFNSDVITGFGVGALVGFLIPHLHKIKQTNSNISFTPYNYNGATGLSFRLQLD